MSINIESLSHYAKTLLLARIAHNLTVSARSTYVQQTVNIAEPQALRGYNELMHLVTSSIRSHVENAEGMPLEAVLEVMNEFGVRFNKMDEINWVLRASQERPLE